MSSLPDCTLISSCFCTNKTNNHALSIEKINEQSDSLMSMPCYLVVFCDKTVISLLKKKRESYGFLSITLFIETELSDMWTYKYRDQVIENREKYFPTRDHRACELSHLINCNKADFILQTMNLNPFQTGKFGWIDCFLGTNARKLCENYTTDILLHVLNNITDKYHINVLNVCDKSFKLKPLKFMYYQNYRYIMCGCFYTCSDKIGRPILNRLKDIFVQTTNAGYGHGDEMLYLEILDEFKNDITRSYGDYGQILNNFIIPKNNYGYIYSHILYKYVYQWYFDEAYDCAKVLVRAIETNTTDTDCERYMKILLDYYVSILTHKPAEAKYIVDHINDIRNKNPLMKKEFDSADQLYGFPKLVN